MGEIYANSYITISATSAKDCGEGFLHHRVPSSRRPFTMPCCFPNGKQGSITLYRRDPDNQEPIHSRAWTLQEDILSPRVLVFGGMELSWKCAGGDGQVSSIPGDMTLVSLRQELSKSQPRRGHVASYHKSDRWEEVMVEFSRRALTEPSDKLPALAGLAERFSKCMPPDSKYLAGLWSPWLIRQLAWRVTENEIGKRPEDFRAPTWSWLSIDGPVVLDLMDEPNSNVSRLADVVGHQVALQTDNAFGKVKEAVVHIKGYSYCVTHGEARDILKGKFPRKGNECLTILDAPLQLKIPETEDLTGYFSYLTLTSSRSPSANYGGPPTFCGLVLRRACQKIIGVYERVGWFRSRWPGFGRGADEPLVATIY